MSYYNHSNARSEEQAQNMRDLEERGVCLFCEEHLKADVEHTIYFESDSWLVTNNKYPYDGTSLHLLLIPKSHVRDLIDLSPKAQASFFEAVTWVKVNWGLDFYGIGIRSGNFSGTGATIEHLHIHLLQGDVSNPEHKGVKVRLSSKMVH